MPKKVSFHTLGCKLNFSETSTLARKFEEGGYVRTPLGHDADICVINSCAVTEHAEKKCRNLIRRLHRDNPGAIIAVTGCYAQLRPERIAAVEGVDIVLGNNDKGSLPQRVAALVGKVGVDGEAHMRVGVQIHSCEASELTDFFAAFSTGDRTRSYLKVQDGCDYKCAYCTIHYARGSSRNASIAELVGRAREIAATGCREIVVTGINTGDFGRSTGESFLDLLRALHGVEGIARYRISSIEPNLLTDDIIAFCAASPKFQHHFHIPLQSGSDEVLGRMRRRYTSAKFRERITALRKAMPDVFVGVDVIVGFPGETDENFAETYRLLEELAPAFLHVFPFSERPGTPAADMDGKVKDYIKTSRVKTLSELSDRLHRDFSRRHAGGEAEVLFENSNKGGFMFGFTGNYIKVRAPFDGALINKVSRVTLAADGSYDATLI